MLVNARSEFIWGIKFGNYRVCLFYYSIIYLYYQLFIHQNYTRSAHILKRGIFLIWGPYRIQPFGKPNVRFGIGRSDMRHRFYIFVKDPIQRYFFRVLLLNYLFIICERNRRNVWTAQSIADNPANKKKNAGMPDLHLRVSPYTRHPDTPTPRLFMCVL
jgi:hypothetical protein